MDTDENSSTGKLVRMIKPGSTILEFGCAEGRMTKYMHEQMGCKVYIVELSPEAFIIANQYAESGVCCNADLLEWKDKFQENYFDYILFADVLEHLQKPDAVLNQVSRLLKKDGQVLVSIPNIGHGDIICSLLCNRFHYTDLGLLDNTHIHFWGRKDFFDFAENAGFVVVEEDATYAPVGGTEQAAFSENLLRFIRHGKRQTPFKQAAEKKV